MTQPKISSSNVLGPGGVVRVTTTAPLVWTTELRREGFPPTPAP